MSYCVNCGVELDESAEKCALCGVPISNPLKADTGASPPYPERIFIPPDTSRRYVGFLISMVILIPNIVCAIANLLLPESGHWAVYVIASSALIWVLFLLPFLMKKVHPYLLLLFDTVAAGGYIYTFYTFEAQAGWFSRVALPLLLGLSLIFGFMIFWLGRRRRDWPYIVIAILLEIALYSVFCEAIIQAFYHNGSLVAYSGIVAACCAALIAFFAVIARSKRFRAWVTRRFYI